MASVQVLFEDQWLLVVNKPAGLPTQSTVDKRRPNLYDNLRRDGRWNYLGLHHRLDVPTSGALLLTKEKSVNKYISEGFKEKTIKKTYNCLLSKCPPWESLRVENHLRAIKGRGGKSLMQEVSSGGDFAATTFRRLECYQSGAMIEAQPHTGRMHQIRVHMAGLGLPILGDALYGQIDSRVSRLMLHAIRLEFHHPKTNKLIVVEAPLAEDFISAKNLLGSRVES